jgi:hypothetical protein
MKDLKSLKKYQNTLIAVFLFAAGFYLYNMFGPNLALLESSDETVGSDLVELLGRLEAAKLDQSLFNSPVYKSLSDFSVEVPSQPTGRRNPFDILGRD